MLLKSPFPQLDSVLTCHVFLLAEFRKKMVEQQVWAAHPLEADKPEECLAVQIRYMYSVSCQTPNWFPAVFFLMWIFLPLWRKNILCAI